MAADADGNVYVADSGAVRVVGVDGVVSTLLDAEAAASLPEPLFTFDIRDIEVDGQGNLYIADFGSATVLRVTPDDEVAVIADAADGLGSPQGLAARDGRLFVSDSRGQIHVIQLP